MREGDKALNDKCLPYIERDKTLLDVGQILVSDGHTMNFQVANPFTGAPCRPTIILFLDWRSNYPLGWEIMLTENTQCIASALRNAILHLGKMPKKLLIDNGKAFKARVFNEKIDLRTAGLSGMFARLGIDTHFARPYNPQEKPIERFWGVFNNWFERYFPSYSGNSIGDKPAWMKPNEAEAKALRGKHLPTISEVNEKLYQWREYYIDQPSRGLDGQTPRQVFEPARGSGVDPLQLYFLMMPMEIKTVHRNGVTFLGWHWYHEALFNYRGQVMIRYSLSDLSRVYVFLPEGQSWKYLCEAMPVEKRHPDAIVSEAPEDMDAVRRENQQRAALRKQVKDLSRLITTKGGQYLVDEIGNKNPGVVKLLETIDKPEDPTTPFIDNDSCEGEALNALEVNDTETSSAPRTELSGPLFPCDWERYEWYMAQDASALNEADRQWLEEYRATDEWRSFYGQKAATAVQ